MKAPAELAMIQIAGVVPRTDQYIGQSVLGYEFWPKGFVAEVAGKARIFIVFFDSPEAAAKSIAGYRDYLKKSNVEPEKAAGDTLFAKDPMHKGLAIRRIGKRLIGAAGFDDPKQALPFLEKLQKNL